MPPGTPPVESPRQLMLKEVFRDTLLTGVLVLIIFLVTNGGFGHLSGTFDVADVLLFECRHDDLPLLLCRLYFG